MTAITRAFLFLLIAACLSGCNIMKITPAERSNVGRELLDLHEAHEKQLIDDAEYERLRNRVLESTLDDEDPMSTGGN